MPTEWPLMSIADCASDEPYSTQIGPFGKALTPEAYVPSGVPLLRGVNVNSGRFHDDDYVFISDADADRLAKFESFPGDVLLVHKGTLGPIGLMPENRRYSRYIMGNSMLRVRCDRKKLLPDYLRYWLKSPEGQTYLLSRVSQVGVPQLQRPLTTLREAMLPVPPLETQEAIVCVLGTLDDKIEQNLRTGSKLEALARAGFKAWFVDFEPVKAKAAGATAFPGMPPETFATLPTRFTNSDLGPVPQGWEVCRLQDVLTLHYGKALNKSQREPGRVPVYGSGGVNGTHSKALVPGPGIIVGRKGSVGTLYWEDQGFFPIDTTFYVEPAAQLGLHYLFELLNTLGLETMNTDAAVPGLNRDNAYRLEVVVPSTVLSQCFEQYAKSLRDLISHTAAESAKLATLRDYLLPRLLNGQLRVCEQTTTESLMSETP